MQVIETAETLVRPGKAITRKVKRNFASSCHPWKRIRWRIDCGGNSWNS